MDHLGSDSPSPGPSPLLTTLTRVTTYSTSNQALVLVLFGGKLPAAEAQ